MSGTARVKISLVAGELEIEGSDAFVNKYSATIDELLVRLLAGKAAPGSVGAGKGKQHEHAVGGDGQEFGEVLHSMPKGASQTDQMLLAGLFAQNGTDDRTFVTGDAKQLLMDQGIKVGNASQCMTNNLKAKRVFKVGDKYRVAKTGEEYLASLTSAGG